MRSTPGRDLGDLFRRRLLLLARRARAAFGCVSVTPGRVSNRPSNRRGSSASCAPERRRFERSAVAPWGRTWARGGSASAIAPHASTSSSSWRRATTCRPTGSPSTLVPTGMLTAGMPEMLNGAVYGTEPMPPTRWPRDLERRRALGDERGRRGGRREDQVDLVEHVGDRAQQLPAPLLREQELVGRQVARSSRDPPRDTGVTSSMRPRAAARWFAEVSIDDTMLHARPGLAADGSRRRRVSMPASAASASAASCVALLDLGIAHREAERRRSTRPRSPRKRARRRARHHGVLVRARGLRQRRGVDVGRAGDRVDVARRVANRAADRARAPT